MLMMWLLEFKRPANILYDSCKSEIKAAQKV